ncbi:uncharacterized protein AKAME5_001501500 [Lates japonicus]|uniref:FXYD domain-containing ion transport regulator n=1 Tax=Lates japonicus TaxID=270547 RepID=A0AAD3MX77_LATJO|nr:uncharacterized protein AKAME5_001501500 [Lates japonicus]
MRPHYCLTICHVSIFVVLAFTVDTVNGVEPAPVTQMALVSSAQDTFWSFVYRVAGIMLFVIIVIAICVTPKRGCKGVCCAGGSKTPPEPSYPASSNGHIYENDP